MNLDVLGYLFGGHSVRKLESIQFPYFGMGEGAFGVGSIGFGCRYSMGYGRLIGLLRIIEGCYSPLVNRTIAL